MAEAILSGMIAGGFEPSDLLVRDIDVRKLKSLEERYGVRAAADDSFFEEAGAIILAVKPQVMAGILSENKERIRKDHLLISIAAGITLKDLKQHVPTDKIVRVMPNTPALIKKGISALCSFKQLEKGEQELVEGINEIVLSGDNPEAIRTDLLVKYVPNKRVLTAGIKESDIPLLIGRNGAGKASVYLCRNNTCQPPVFSAESLISLIDRGKKQ